MLLPWSYTCKLPLPNFLLYARRNIQKEIHRFRQNATVKCFSSVRPSVLAHQRGTNAISSPVLLPARFYTALSAVFSNSVKVHGAGTFLRSLLYPYHLEGVWHVVNAYLVFISEGWFKRTSPIVALKSLPVCLWQRKPRGARGVRATPVPQFLSPYAPEGSLNRFKGALGNDMLTTRSTNRRSQAFLGNFLVFILAYKLQIQISTLSPPILTLANWKTKTLSAPIQERNTQRACALSSHRVQLDGMWV